MAKLKLIAARNLEIIGVEGLVEGGTLLGTIETDCEVSSLISALHFGSVRVENEEDAAVASEGDAAGNKTKRRTTKAAATTAPAGDAGAKSGNTNTRRRR